MNKPHHKNGSYMENPENIVPPNMVNLTVMANNKSDINKIQHNKYKRMLLNVF